MCVCVCVCVWKIQITEKHSGKIWFFDLREGAKELEVKQK